MKMTIAENIRAMRKERKLTQEQLAEALGVTVGAVSKWEGSLSVPDISLIMELADFFDTSVDVLLGYDKQSSSLSQTLELLKRCRRGKDFATGCKEAEKAILRYPNSFELIYECAMLFALAGVEKEKPEHWRRSLQLHQRALELLPQNANPNISEIGIKRDMADLHIMLDEADVAIEMLRGSNYQGINDTSIGFALATRCHKPEEALPYLSSAMITTMLQSMTALCRGFASSYEQLDNLDDAAYALEWYCGILQGMRKGDRVTYLDRLEAIFCVPIAQLNARLGNIDKAREALRRSITLLRRYQTAPCYTMEGIRFFHGSGTEMAYDDFGEDWMDGLYRRITEDEEAAEQMKLLWEELINE